MRALRIAGIVIAVLVAVPVLGLALAWLMLDPNEHKGRAEAAFRDATGRELRLEGPLSVSILPWLAVESGRAAVSNADGFGDAPFASFERARLGVRLWPLLTARRLEFGPVRLDGLSLHLLVAKDGRNNWSDVLDRFDQRTPAQPASPTSGSEGGLRIASVDVRDASVSFTDAHAGTQYAVTQWQLRTGSLERGGAVDVDTSLRLARDERQVGRLTLRTRLDLSQPERVVLAETAGTLRLPSERRPDGIEVNLHAPRIELETASRNVSIRDFEAHLGEAALAGHVLVVQADAGRRVDGNVRLAPTDPRKLLEHLGLEAPRTRDPQALKRLGASAHVAYTTARGLRFDDLALQLDETRLEGRADVRFGERLAVRFDLRGKALDADRYRPPA